MNKSPRPSGYLPTLDGWRAIAILAVIFHHDAIHSLGSLNTKWLFNYGYAGVDVFFAISGILICSRLLDEEKRNGFVDIRRFYVRRAFRILPPAVFYLIVVALLAHWSVIPVSYREWFEALSFCRNYPTIFGGVAAEMGGWYTGHFWSLSLEEQYYLVFPAILVFTRPRYRAPLLAVLCAIIAIHRAVALHSHIWNHVSVHADVRIDALFVPALFAVMVSSAQARRLAKRLLRFWPALVVAALALIPFESGAAWHVTTMIWLMPCIVLGSVLNPDNLFGKALESSWLRYVGRISYSLYLWQELFFVQHFQLESPLGLFQSWPLRLILTFGCALGSYYLLEKPLARLGHKWAPPPTRGRPDLESSVVETTTA